MPRAFFLFLAEAKILAPFLCAALLPFDRPDATNRSSRFSLVFDTPNSFAVSSAVAKVEFRTIAILILSFYDTLIYPKKPEASFIFMISPSTKLRSHWVPQPSVAPAPAGWGRLRVLTFPPPFRPRPAFVPFLRTNLISTVLVGGTAIPGCAATHCHQPSRTLANRKPFPYDHLRHVFPPKKTRAGKNACATLEPFSHDLLPPQPSPLTPRRQNHFPHLEALRFFACFRAEETRRNQ